ncbi:tetratricopeptide repeat protein [Candidatus Fermentibacterales bacterium]|nr:tetratricopeptide repeat protein [Candidatus Fermentibacterales bacterium]
MAGKADSNKQSAEMSTEQLLTEIGKLLFALNKQVVVVTQKLEGMEKSFGDGMDGRLASIAEALQKGDLSEGLGRIEEAVSKRIAEKLDMLDELRTSVQKIAEGGLPAGEGAPDGSASGAVLEKLDAMLGKLEVLGDVSSGISALAAGAGDQTGSAVVIEKAASDIVEKLEAVLEKLEAVSGLPAAVAGLAEQASGEAGGLGALEQAAVGMSGKLDALLEKLDAIGNSLVPIVAQSELAPRAADARTAELAERLEQLRTEVSAGNAAMEALRKDGAEGWKSAVSGFADEIGKLGKLLSDSVSEASQKQSAGFVEAVSPVREAVSSVRDALDRLEQSLVKEYAGAGEKTLEKMTAIGEGVAGLSGLLAGIPQAVSGSEERLTERLADVSRAGSEGTDKLLEEIGATRKDIGTLSGDVARNAEATKTSVDSITQEVGKASKSISGMSDTLEKTTESSNASIEEIRKLLEVHRDQVKVAEVTSFNDQAIAHFNNAEYALAEDAMMKALERDDSRPELWANLGHIQAAQKKWDDSEQSYRKALQLDPELAPALSGLGGLLISAGRPDQSLEFLKRFLEDDKPAAWALLSYSRALSEVGSHAQAVELLEKAVKLYPGNAELEQEYNRYRES